MEAAALIQRQDTTLIVRGQKIIDDPGSEENQGKNLVNAAVEAGAQCFVWSTLPSSAAISGGRLVSRIYEGAFILLNSDK